MARCKSCSAEILWVKTSRGKSMPIDAAPVENGNIVLDARHQTVVVHGTPQDGLNHLSHFVTCPNAHEHRRKN